MSDTFSNGLSDAQLERLAILAEELGEAQQAIGKILRHGYESQNPDEPSSQVTNRTELEKELGDVSYAIALLSVNGDVDNPRIHKRVIYKAEAIQKYLHHQKNAAQPIQRSEEA